MQSVLVIDDNEDIRFLLREFLSTNGFEVIDAPDGEAGMDLLRRQRFDLFLVDLVMPGKGGFEVLQEVKDLSIDVPAIVITGNGSIESAVDAMRLGAFDYIEKPFNLEALRITVDRALSHRRLEKENATLKRQLSDKYDFRNFIGNSPRMQGLYRILEKISNTDSTILITGESGTGKELVANDDPLHPARGRTSRSSPINCGAIPETSSSASCSGTRRAPSPGAVRHAVGRFEMANGGTLFLDEIGDIPLDLQVEAAARGPGAGLRADRRDEDHQGERAHPRRDEPGAGEGGVRGFLPGGSLLPAERDPAAYPTPARSGRRHHAAL